MRNLIYIYIYLLRNICHTCQAMHMFNDIFELYKLVSCNGFVRIL